MKSKSDENRNLFQNKYGLTSMQMKVLGYLPTGMARKEMAEEVKLIIHTIDFHLSKAYKKLGVRNEAEAVAKMLGENILVPATSTNHNLQK